MSEGRFSYPDVGRVDSRFRPSLLRRNAWRTDFKLAAKALAFWTVGISLWALMVALLRHQVFFPQYGVTIWEILETYCLAAAIALLPLTFLMPLTRLRWGRAFAGYVLGAIFYSTIGVKMYRSEGILTVVSIGLILGFGTLGVGLVTFDEEHVEGMSRRKKVIRIAKLVVFGVALVGVVWLLIGAQHCLISSYCRR